MTLIKTDASPFVDDKYGLIKNIYDLPTYSGLPRIAVKMAFGGDYSTAGFNASGAGITAQHAKNSAIGEYIERFSCLHQGNVKVLKKENYVSPKRLNSLAKGVETDYMWVEGKDIIEDKSIMLPADAIYLTYRSDDNSSKGKWVTTSTGAACGQNLAQTCWKGIAEILERDSFQYHWRRQLSCQEIDLSSNKELQDYYLQYIDSENIKIKLYKFDMDWQVPSVFGVAEFENGGCVVAASVRMTWIEACKKTLLELAQSIIGYAAVIFKDDKTEITDFSQVREYQDHSILYIWDNMARNLDFLQSKGEKFQIPSEVLEKDDTKILNFFVSEIKKIRQHIYFVDVTTSPLKNSDWLVGKTIITDMLDIEPNYIPILNSSRLEEIDKNMIRLHLRTEEELKNPQPKVPHPFP